MHWGLRNLPSKSLVYTAKGRCSQSWRLIFENKYNYVSIVKYYVIISFCVRYQGGVVLNQSGSQQDVMSNNNSDEEDEEEEEENDEDDDDDDVAAASVPDGMYDPSEFEHLNVGPDVKDLFTHIMRYTPQSVDLETKFKPFIPEYIPAVG